MNVKEDSKENNNQNKQYELLEKAKMGDAGAREQLILDNMGLVHLVVKRMGRSGDYEDLIQIGIIGLIKAIDRFDVKSGYTLSTYAVPLILGELKVFLRNDGMIHISRKVKEDARKIAIVREKYEKSNNTPITTEMLEKMTGLSREEIVNALEASSSTVSIHSPLGESQCVIDVIPDCNNQQEKVENKLTVKSLLQDLSGEDRTLIYLRYVKCMTQSETARQLGLNQVAVSRREKKILGELRRNL